jgi:hypothetical protein
VELERQGSRIFAIFCGRKIIVNFTTTYNLIDSWRLSKRWEQEILQTKREMIAFVNYFQDLHVNLMDDLSIQQIIHQSYI